MSNPILATVTPFRHVLTFFYRGHSWKALFYAPDKPAMLRKQSGPWTDNYEIAWSTVQARPGDSVLSRGHLRRATEIMQHWNWPHRLDVLKPLLPGLDKPAVRMAA